MIVRSLAGRPLAGRPRPLLRSLAAAGLLLAPSIVPPAGAQETSRPATTQTATAQTRPGPLTLDMIFGPQRVDFDGSYESGQEWLDDGVHYLHRRDGVLAKVNAATGEAGPAYDVEALEAALKASGHFDERAARDRARRLTLTTQDRAAALIAHDKHLYHYRFADRRLTRLTRQPGEFPWLAFSPKGRYVSFVRDFDLYVIDVESGRQRRLTTGGSEELRNAHFDWVYAEEVYGHGTRAYWWSPDEACVAYVQLNEQGVKRFTVVDHIPYTLDVEQSLYPKAGDPNPTIRLGVVRPTGGPTRWVDLSKYEGIEFLIVRVGWSPDVRVSFQVQDREQRWLDLNEADPRTGRAQTLFRETSPAWVNVLDEPHWLKDGSFLWSSERDGWQHLYRYSRAGVLLGRLTAGDWEARTLHGVDEQAGWVYFSGTRDSPIQSHAYRVRLDGTGLERLTEPGFSHRVAFDPRFGCFIDTFSNATTPPRVHLRSADGGLIRVISANEVAALREFDFPAPRFLRVPARDGYLMNAMLLLPADLEPGRRYPVLSYTYSGPHAPSVHDSWRGSAHLVEQMLAQKGYITWICDNRSASGQGAVSSWQAYQRLGESELADLEDGLRWLIENYPCVDPARIGLWGHSYGGFMTCYALTHSTMFKVGVAGAPVTDWRNYDTIYTERYMRTPQNNPDGYERTAPAKAARNLAGRLLLVHGTMDDNVHFQNTVQFLHELHRAGRHGDVMIYPKARHGIGPARHYVETRLEFIFEHL